MESGNFWCQLLIKLAITPYQRSLGKSILVPTIFSNKRKASLNKAYVFLTEFYECETKFTADKMIHRNMRTNGMK